tara:strand:- start:39178 stop:39321 length:144 start_codon:yes stop_codon:yes gene_type:complete
MMILSQINIQQFRGSNKTPQMRSGEKPEQLKKDKASKCQYSWFKKSA